MSRDFLGAGSGRLQVDAAAPINITGTELTLAAWIYPDVIGGFLRFIGKGHVSNQQQYVLQLEGGISMIVSDGAGQDKVFGGTTTVGVWQHAAGVKTAGNIKTYVNGVLGGDGASSRSIVNFAVPLMLGGRADAQFDYNGLMAEAAIWDVALSATEILSLAQGNCPLFFRRDRLRGYWPIFGAGLPEAELSGQDLDAGTSGTAPLGARHAPVGRIAPFAG